MNSSANHTDELCIFRTTTAVATGQPNGLYRNITYVAQPVRGGDDANPVSTVGDDQIPDRLTYDNILGSQRTGFHEAAFFSAAERKSARSVVAVLTSLAKNGESRRYWVLGKARACVAREARTRLLPTYTKTDTHAGVEALRDDNDKKFPSAPTLMI